ncbi:fructosamine kinase family protein [Flavobacteriaceae sp. LMIT009]
MLTESFLEHISHVIDYKTQNIKSISGGDIASAYLLETSTEKLFLKVHSNVKLLQAEAHALNTIANTNCIATPNIHAIGNYENNGFLVMEYIESKSPNSRDFELFGTQLATLHQTSSEYFGFDQNNFIGSLPQSNNQHSTWLDFYIEERLNPQLQLSIDKGLLHQKEVPTVKKMKESCTHIFQNIKPSILHGDLWSENFLISADGIPYLIDPSTYLGHAEIDIAMSKLFGGFGSSFYESYHKIIPQDHYTSKRIELYQLYYLLVHLNLFGRSYYASVKHILTKYF